jgi:hypothetical protein
MHLCVYLAGRSLIQPPAGIFLAGRSLLQPPAGFVLCLALALPCLGAACVPSELTVVWLSDQLACRVACCFM